MTIAQSILGELKQEAIATRKMLELIPFDKAAWKPHEKSMPLAHLATHVAELPSYITYTIEQNELDFATFDYKREDADSNKSLLEKFDSNLSKAEVSLSKCSDADIMKDWTLRSGEKIFFTMPRVHVIRSMSLSHLVHHRAQLGVYMRLLDIPLPSVYGPTADEQMEK
jgi:uncharacterized damage-inducible protein DinB